ADARDIVGALRVGGARAPPASLLVAGRGRGDPGADHHVEVEARAPALELHLVHQADIRLDSDAGEVAGVSERQALLVAVPDQDLEGERRAMPIDQAGAA